MTQTLTLTLEVITEGSSIRHTTRVSSLDGVSMRGPHRLLLLSFHSCGRWKAGSRPGLKAAGLEICAAVGSFSEKELGGAYGKGRGEEGPQEQAALTSPLPDTGCRGSLCLASVACATSNRPRTVGSIEGAAHHQWPDFYETLFGFLNVS